MGPAEIQAHCRLDEAGDRLHKAAVQQLQLSARAYHRVLKLAHTIADLSGADYIETSYLAEVLQYRSRRWGEAVPSGRLLLAGSVARVPVRCPFPSQYLVVTVDRGTADHSLKGLRSRRTLEPESRRRSFGTGIDRIFPGIDSGSAAR